MNIDNLIKQWGDYERVSLERGCGYSKQTVIARWAESQAHGSFSSRLPVGIEFKNLTDDVIKIRKAVSELQIKQKNAIFYKFVLRGYMTDELCSFYLEVSRSTAFNNLREGRKNISLYLKVNYPLLF